VAYYSVIIGQSVSNCGAGNNETTKTTLGGTFELEHSFSVETTTGASLGMIGPSVSSSTTIKTGTAEKITKSQQIEVNIPPGQRVRDQCWGRSAGADGRSFRVPLSPIFHTQRHQETSKLTTGEHKV
jgi:hypothetical protein